LDEAPHTSIPDVPRQFASSVSRSLRLRLNRKGVRNDLKTVAIQDDVP
jgi:hypothetical protein